MKNLGQLNLMLNIPKAIEGVAVKKE